MICQIELGRSTPTVSVLWKLAHALGIPFTSLIGEESSGRCVVLRAETAKVLTSRDGGFTSRALFPTDATATVEFYELTLKGGSIESAAARPHGCTQNVVVARGSLTIGVRGERYRLETGDAIFFDADSPHEYSNDGTEVARAYLLLTYTARQAHFGRP